MFNARWLIFGLIFLFLSLQIKIWFSEDGYRKSLKLKDEVAKQATLNDMLRNRNSALDSEVLNLKRGEDAAEERARTDLGMIGENETFYQVVPKNNKTK